ncbi:MAG TPA: hypothetical protein VMF89_11670 [Polyangiales bacterium]|nr:hypothetical protein [Polyangiales bacterium]
MGFSFTSSFRVMPVLLCAALSLASGCFGTVRGGYVDVAYAPANYAAYPAYTYDGANVYFIDGRWYRHDHGRWVYYRREPSELYRYRTRGHYVVAPPARGRAYRQSNVYSAPPARPARAYRAPPARRDDRSYRAPPARRDDRSYRAPPARDRGRDRDDRRRHGRD